MVVLNYLDTFPLRGRKSVVPLEYFLLSRFIQKLSKQALRSAKKHLSNSKLGYEHVLNEYPGIATSEAILPSCISAS